MTVARVTELTASSKKGIEAAIESAVERASRTLRGITGIEVQSIKAKIEKGKVQEYRVTMKVTFILED